MPRGPAGAGGAGEPGGRGQLGAVVGRGRGTPRGGHAEPRGCGGAVEGRGAVEGLGSRSLRGANSWEYLDGAGAGAAEGLLLRQGTAERLRGAGGERRGWGAGLLGRAGAAAGVRAAEEPRGAPASLCRAAHGPASCRCSARLFTFGGGGD